VTPLDKLEEPASLMELRRQVDALIPRVDLPEALLEVQAWTGFADEFHHISERRTQVQDLALSVCAVLTAEACNLPLEPVVRNEIPALSYARLAWVQQNHIRAETLSRGNARLVREQSRIPLVKSWGGGEVASADGLRFVVPVKTLHGGLNRKYFPGQRGVTYYNFVSNQFSGFHGIVIPGTLGESPYLLDGLLEHHTDLQPQQIITDTAGYSDLIFGLFWLLGFPFSPRLADLGEARWWRLDKEAHYGVLHGVARHCLQGEWITKHWDEFLRVAGSLKMGAVKASELIRGLQRGSKISTLGRSLAELGRIPKTLHLLHYISDPDYRRHCLTQLNRHEGRNGLARHVFHGQSGELRRKYREGQEDQWGALGLVVNALVLWTTRYMDAALAHLRAHGALVKPEDVARLSPLSSKQFHVLGRYHFNVSEEAVRRGELRPLRSPNGFEPEMLIA
jgi:TnpA family transposase